MNRYFVILLTIFMVKFAGASQPVYQDGDIIFHRSLSRQSHAIAAATGSRYTHMGIIFIENGKPVVYEAIQPVKKTPLKTWTKRGKDGHFVVRRLKDKSKLDIPSLKSEITSFMGKDYDFLFAWSDAKIYCSELVWKGYDRSNGIKIGKLKKLREFDLSHGNVQQTMSKRYGKNAPLDMEIISPSDMFDSKLLITVFTNFPDADPIPDQTEKEETTKPRSFFKKIADLF